MILTHTLALTDWLAPSKTGKIKRQRGWTKLLSRHDSKAPRIHRQQLGKRKQKPEEPIEDGAEYAVNRESRPERLPPMFHIS